MKTLRSAFLSFLFCALFLVFSTFGIIAGRDGEEIGSSSLPPKSQSGGASNPGFQTPDRKITSGSASRTAPTPVQTPVSAPGIQPFRRAGSEPPPHHSPKLSAGASSRELFPQSNLHDGRSLEFNLISKAGVKKLAYMPYAEHVNLATACNAKSATNVVKASLVFFVRNNDKSRDNVTVHLGETFIPAFNGTDEYYRTHVLARLYEHCPERRPKIIETMQDGLKAHVANQLHHSEQWLAIHLHDQIKDYMFLLLRECPEIQKIYGMGVNVYSTNDVCGHCGAMFETTLPALKNDILRFCQTGRLQVAKRFSLFSTISSSIRYPTPFKDRPRLPGFEDTRDFYRDFYSTSRGVKKEAQSLKESSSLCFYFWVPRPEYETVSARLERSYPGIKFSYNEATQAVTATIVNIRSFKELIAGSFPINRIRSLDFTGTQYEVITSDQQDGLINPSDIKKCLDIRELLLANTKVHSLSIQTIYLGSTLQALTKLTVLDLRGALVQHRDNGSIIQRSGLFKALGRMRSLKTLRLGVYPSLGSAIAVPLSNNITFHEFKTLIEPDTAVDCPLKNIETLEVDGNRIFQPEEADIERFAEILKRFISHPKRSSGQSLLIDLSNNGEELHMDGLASLKETLSPHKLKFNETAAESDEEEGDEGKITEDVDDLIQQLYSLPSTVGQAAD